MQFLPRRRPLELNAQRIRALRPSLNTPVVAMAELPAGPACAAILVHVEPGHGLQISVGVRSLASGAVALYGFDGPISSAVVGIALDAALSFAESMGFLFDDVIGDDASSREKAVLRWQELIGDRAPTPPAETTEPDPGSLFEPDGGELTDPTSGDDSEPGAEAQPDLDASDAPAADLEFQAPPADAGPALSKFRVQPGGAGGAASAPEGSAETEAGAQRKRPLGRMRLVKRRPGEAAQDARRVWLLRVLTSF